MVFIRALKIEQVARRVEVLAQEGNDPVLVREGKVMAATFHPELTNDARVHETFLELVRNCHSNRLVSMLGVCQNVLDDIATCLPERS